MLEESQVKFHHRKTFLELQSETAFQHSPKQWGLKSKKQTNQKKKRQKQNKHKNGFVLLGWCNPSLQCTAVKTYIRV